MSLSILWMGYIFLIVFLFNALKSMHVLKVPSLFFTITIEEANWPELGLMRPNSKSYLMAHSISSRILLGFPKGRILIGCVPIYNSILWSTPLSGVLPGGRSPKTF